LFYFFFLSRVFAQLHEGSILPMQYRNSTKANSSRRHCNQCCSILQLQSRKGTQGNHVHCNIVASGKSLVGPPSRPLKPPPFSRRRRRRRPCHQHPWHRLSCPQRPWHRPPLSFCSFQPRSSPSTSLRTHQLQLCHR